VAAPYKRHKAKLMRKHKNCHYCGCVLTKQNRTIDHVIPQSILGNGKHSARNLTLACKTCNSKKGDKLAFGSDEFLHRLWSDVNKELRKDCLELADAHTGKVF